MLLSSPTRLWFKGFYLAVISALVIAAIAPQAMPAKASSAAAPPHAPNAVTALQFDGTNDYVTFGAAPTLGLATFTIETWFRRDGTGTPTTTGTGGVTNAIPLVTKGRGEAEGSNVDMNWFLGINNTTGTIAADFEDMATGANHPVNGVTVIQNGVWYHAGATYDGTTWRLYLNGNLETTTAANATPRSDSIQHAAIGSAQTSTAVAAGYFNGAIDEARIWNVARTQQEIRDNLGLEVTAGTGLVARWGMNEGSGATINGTGSGVVQGTLTNGPTWVAGTPFQLTAIFRDGLNSYTGTVDTFLWEYEATSGHGTAPEVRWDTVGTPSGAIYGLTRFDNIFGTSSGQIATGATIISATLTYVVTDTGDLANVYEVLIDWPETETYNTFGGEAGVQSDEYGSLVTTAAATAASAYTITVTSSLAAWSADPALNRGWIFAPTGSGGVQFRSSENATTAQRPTLRVIYTFTPPAAPNAPSNLSVTGLSNDRIQLAWADNSTNENNFEIERSTTGSGGPFSLLTTVAASTTTYLNTGLTLATPYCYRVRATNALGNSTYSNVSCGTTTASANNAIDFSGTNTYVTFGDPAALDLEQYTIETWFRRDGTGAATTTGSLGIPAAIPLISNGAQEAENSNVDVNYILCIDSATNTLCADFEEGAGGTGPLGLNHPVYGTTAIQNEVWYHAAATYDGSRWKLYLNGNLEADLLVGQPANTANISPNALATSLNSTGVVNGSFDGVLDEARIWNSARTQTQIRSAINSQLATPQAGLVARWGLNEGSGTAVGDTSGSAGNGTITNSNYQWVPGAPFNINLSPDAPVLVAPSNGATSLLNSTPLSVTVTDPEANQLAVTFYGRAISNTGVPTFTVIAMPDTQYYAAQLNGGTAGMFISQTQWIANNKNARNIAYVMQLGDCVEHGDQFEIEWQRANTAFQIIENPITTQLLDGIPYGIAAGNHDQTPIGDPNGTTTFYNQYFGVARFGNRAYYGDPYPYNPGDIYPSTVSNDNHYDLFSVGGMDFIVLYFEYDTTPDAPILTWADNLLTTYSNRKAIVVTHHLIGAGPNAAWSAQGSAIYNALRSRPNLFLMLGGHVVDNREGQRTDVYNGNTVYSLMSDYQGRPNGGNGLLRIMEFAPSASQIRVSTYSPYTGTFETDADSQFTLSYPFSQPFQTLGVVTVTSGSTANMIWSGLSPNTQYEWYAVANDGNSSTTGVTHSFTTADFAFADNDDVCAGNEPCYPSIQGALNSVGSSGLVTIYDGAYAEAFALTKNATVSIANGAVVNLTGPFTQTAGTFNVNNSTLNLTGDFTYSDGSFNAGAGSIGFNGGTTQNLNLGAPIVFNNLTVGAGTTLIETNSTDNVTVNGTLSNHGTIRKIKAIGGSGPIGLGLTGVQMNIQAQGTLSSLAIDRIDQDHPNASNNNLRTGRYWSITPTGGSYTANLTLPHNNVNDPKVCRYTGTGFNCAADSATASTVTRLNVTAFSEWTVGSHVGPTAVGVTSLKASSGDQPIIWPWLLVCALLGSLALSVLVAWERRVKKHH